MNLQEFTASCNQCETVQRAVLSEILSVNSCSVPGRKYHFEQLKTVDDFRSTVPIMNWQDLEPYALEAEKGAVDQLFAGVPEQFICTSGTTGQKKIIPESTRGLQEKARITSLRMEALLQHVPRLMESKIFPLANTPVVGMTSCGIPYGTASGITLMNAPEKWRRLLAYPVEVLTVEDPDAQDYILMRFAVAEDIRLIVCNNSGRLEQLAAVVEKNSEILIKDIRQGTIHSGISIPSELRATLEKSLAPNPEKAERLEAHIRMAGRLLPAAYWPDLAVISCWLAGSVGRYVERIRPLFDRNVQFMDCGYGATEGKFNVPLQLNEPAGPLAIHSGFYEFSLPGDRNNLLLAHELQDGELYELYCTSYSGMYRYAIHDIIRVAGFTGSTPNIYFETKTKDIANICGEKLAPSLLGAAVAAACESAGVTAGNWCVVTESSTLRYNFCLELNDSRSAGDADLCRHLAMEIESDLYGDGTLPYPVFRKQDLIKPAMVTLMKNGWTAARVDSRKKPGDSGNQLKLPLVCPTVPLPEFTICTSEDRS